MRISDWSSDVCSSDLQTADDQATTGSGTFDPSQTIIVTGSRVSDRTVADSPVPVDVIGGEQLQNSGYSETNKVLNQLVPSFNFPQPSLTDGTDSMRPATLRGLALAQTLVLIHGTRSHTQALTTPHGTVGARPKRAAGRGGDGGVR